MKKNEAEISYLDEKEFSIKDFRIFMSNNKTLFIASFSAVLAVFGVRLFNICFGIDTEYHITKGLHSEWLSIGRFGLVGLQNLWTNFLPQKELFNPYLASMFGCVFLFLGTLHWCYLIDFFSKGKINRKLLVPFAILFICHQTWIEQIYFVCQAAECLFIVLVSPVAVYFLFKGAIETDIKKILFGGLISVFCVSVYQGVIMLIFCAIFSMFVLFRENCELEVKKQIRICAVLILSMITITLMYFMLDKIVRIILRVQKSEYLTDQIGANDSIFYWIKRLFKYFYLLYFADSVFSQFLEPIMAKFARTGWEAVSAMKDSTHYSNVLFFPALIVFFAQIFKNRKKQILYILSAVAAFLCIFALPFAYGGYSPFRAQYVLPFATSFIILYAVNSTRKNKYIYRISATLFFLVGIQQMLVCSMLNYCDVLRFNEEILLCKEIDLKIKETGAAADTPVFFFGIHSPKFSKNFIKAEDDVAHSPLECVNEKDICDATSRGISLMNALGYNYKRVDNNDKARIQKARETAENMNDFPYPNSVKNLGDVVVVRLSESSYNPF